LTAIFLVLGLFSPPSLSYLIWNIGMPETILIAATDPNIVYLFQRYAEESGFRSVCIGFEEDLLCQVKQISPVLIILQIEPLETAWQHLLEHLKDDPVTSDIPVVAYSYLDEVNSNQVDGISGILQKSVLYNEFVSALKQAGVQSE
jgi:CheY-like chemotaxis protein